MKVSTLVPARTSRIWLLCTKTLQFEQLCFLAHIPTPSVNLSVLQLPARTEGYKADDGFYINQILDFIMLLRLKSKTERLNVPIC